MHNPTSIEISSDLQSCGISTLLAKDTLSVQNSKVCNQPPLSKRERDSQHFAVHHSCETPFGVAGGLDLPLENGADGGHITMVLSV